MSHPKDDDGKTLDPKKSQKKTFAEVAARTPLLKKYEMHSNIEYVPTGQSTQTTGNQVQKMVLPPAPDFNSLPYTSPKGRAFGAPEYDKLADSMDDQVSDLYTICLLIGGIVTANPRDLEDAGLFDNILALEQKGVEEVRLSSYKIAWRLLIGNWKFEDLVKEELLIDTIKRNIRCSQRVTRLDVSNKNSGQPRSRRRIPPGV